MKEDHKTKKQLKQELAELRSQNAELKKSITRTISDELVAEETTRYAESIVATVREPLLVLDTDLKVISANRNFYRAFKATPGETIGSYIYDLGNKQWDIPKLRELLEEVLPEKEAFDDFEVDHNFQDIGHKVMLLNARQVYRKDVDAKMILLAIEDITERKRLDSLLIGSEEQYRRVFETASDGIVLLEKREGKITHVNPATEKILGYTAKESIGNSLQDIGVSLDLGDFRVTMQTLNRTGMIKYDSVPAKTKSGQHIDTDIYLVDRARLVQCNIRDITERKQTEDKIKRQTDAMEAATDGMALLNENAEYIYLNQAHARIYGYENAGELIGKSWRTLYDADEIKRFDTEIMPKFGQEGSWQGEALGMKKDGSKFPQEMSLTALASGGLICVVRDITKRKRAEELLKESESKYRMIAENMTDVIMIMDMNLRLTYVSPSIIRMRGYTDKEVMKQSLEQIMTLESLQIIAKVFEEEMQREASGTADPDRVRTLELEEYRKDMSTIWVEVSLSLLRDADRRPIGILSLSRDISERKQAEETLRESEEKYREIVKYAPAGIYEVDYETNRFISMNDVICEYTGYSRDELATMNLFNLLTTESQRRMLARLEKLMVGEKLEPTVEYCIRTKDGNEIWGLFNARYIYEAGKLKGSTGVIYDITKRKRAEEELQRTLESLRKAVGVTIQVMVSAVEVRDPYTAGHQLRSADLARTIATEMGLPQEKIDGLRMAGSIHDIGKLSIPAEILSKPTKLTNLEFSLIEEHSRQGYEMLKDVESPWPLAEIVYQHHERMDGSGYPRNLKGDEILVEARIMAVADVVEAMASHRPYRPGKGIDAALEEIEKNKGTLYDDAVADVCLRLFREQGFRLKRA